MHRDVMLRVRPVEWSSTHCRVVDDLMLASRVETVRRGASPLLGTLRCKLGAVRVKMMMVA